MPKQSRSAADAVSATDTRVIPIVEEQAVLFKRKTLTEGVPVRTVVREDEAIIDEPIATETVEVERVPLDRWVEGPVPVRQEDDTTIVTLLKEVRGGSVAGAEMLGRCRLPKLRVRRGSMPARRLGRRTKVPWISGN